VLIEEQLRRQFLAIDQTLRILRREWERDRTNFDLATWGREIVALADVTLQIFITDAHGIIRASSRPELIGNDLSTRDYFRHEADLPRDDDRMFVGSLRQGMVTRQWQLNMVRRLNEPDGSFAGVISASYDPNTIVKLYGEAEVGARGLIAVVSVPDGGIRAIAGPGQTSSAGSVAGSAMFEALLSNPHGFWVGPSATDGSERIHAFRDVPDRNLTVVVAFDESEALSEAAAWERGALIVAGCITGILALAAALVFNRNRAARLREEQFARDRAVLTAANAELAASRAQVHAKAGQLEATLAGMSDGIMMVDPNLHLIEWNAHFPEFTGVPSEILRPGLPMNEILRAQAEAGEFGDVDVEPEVVRRLALLRSGASLGTIERRRPGGRIMELRRSAILGGGFVTVYTDVTARRQAEDRARQAEKLAAIGRFTAGVAHDFNNLLSSIVGTADLMHHRLGAQDERSRYIERILETAQKGAALVRQLLMSTQRQALSPTLVDVNAVVLGMIDLLRATIGPAVDIDTGLSSGLWLALIDQSQIERAILNLAVNARDAMPDGGVLTITTMNVHGDGRDLEDRDHVVLAVSDTGTGMSEEVIRNASEPFFTTKPVGKGTGLGLSQVHGLAQHSGGTVQISSELGKGTTVRIAFPRGEGQVPIPMEVGTGLITGTEDFPSPPVEAIGPDRRRPRVLLVDGDDEFRETLSAMLRTTGYMPIAAASRAEAVRIIEERVGFEVLLLDMAMSDSDRVMISDAAREWDPGVPVVVMTAQTANGLSTERKVLAKPFLIDALAGTLSAALGYRKGK
jgi:signal transduction histidine kinase